MQNNDVLRRLRYALDLNDAKMIEIFALGGLEVSRPDLRDALLKDEEEDFLELENHHLEAFLKGLITSRRGAQEPRPGPPPPPVAFNNNAILKALRIALAYKDEDIVHVLTLANFRIAKPELSALFRQPGHKNYREAGDQVLRNFLQGLTVKLRGPREA